MLRARDVMQSHVLAVGPDSSLLDVHRLFAEEQISAAPVVDDAEQVVGVITTADLVRVLDEERDTARVEAVYYREWLPYSSPDWSSAPEDLQNRLIQLRVSDAMTMGLTHVSPDASVAEVAQTLLKHRLHHVFVVEEGTLQGIVSTFDLLALVERLRDL